MANRASSLGNLPDELLADITVCGARSSVKDCASLDKVNKAFRRHWNTEGVRRVCHLGPLEFVPAIGESAEIMSLAVAMTQFCQVGNPDALHREGIISYFDSRRTERADEGLAQLQSVADDGHIKVRFLYVMILVSSALERSDEGFSILATLMQPRLLESMRRIGLLSDDLTFKYLSKLHGGPKKAVYMLVKFHVDCDYNDLDGNRDYMDDAYYWSIEAVAYDPPNDPMCQKCFWDRETNLLFHTLLPEMCSERINCVSKTAD